MRACMRVERERGGSERVLYFYSTNQKRCINMEIDHHAYYYYYYYYYCCSYLPNPSTRAGYDTRSIFKRSLTGLNSEFSFS